MRILVTSAECRMAYVCIVCLGRAGYEVDCCSESPFAMSRWSRYVAKFHRTPDPAGDAIHFVRTVAAIVRARGIEVVMPTHEEVLPLLEHRGELPVSVLIAAPTIENVRLGFDKAELSRLAATVNIPSPETLAPGSMEEAMQYLERLNSPLVLKPRRGNGGKGIQLLGRADGRGRAYQQYCELYRHPQHHLPILQEYVEGEVVGCGFLAVNGKMRAAFTERYVRLRSGIGGPSVLREPLREVRIEKIAAMFCEATKWNGIGHADFILPKNGELPLLIDLNPRFWGAVSLAVANGMNFPLAALAMARSDGGVAQYFHRSPRRMRSQWIAGELMELFNNIALHRWSEAFRCLIALLPSPDKAYDEVTSYDVAPLFTELAYYFIRYCQSGFHPRTSVGDSLSERAKF